MADPAPRPLTATRLARRRALVTGSSKGIGRATAIRFAAEGASVAINYAGSRHDAEETLALATAASREAGFAHGHTVLQADVGDPRQAEALVERAIEDLGGLDILVNNAGFQIETPSEDHPIDDVRRVLDVNLIGALAASQAAIRHFLARNRPGVILNCSSVHQIIPKPGFIGYSLSKGAMANLTRTLALEYADRGIRVNAVGPGAIDTPMNKAWTGDPEARAIVEAHIPMRRAGEPEEIAAVFAFLASDDASYMTGQTIYACGGITLFAEFKENWAS